VDVAARLSWPRRIPCVAARPGAVACSSEADWNEAVLTKPSRHGFRLTEQPHPTDPTAAAAAFSEFSRCKTPLASADLKYQTQS
jgi:hypothetical protein